MRMVAMIGAAMTLMSAAPAAAAESVDVMVLGTYHFANPGQDLNNIKADDVTVPTRQAELEALAEALAGFRPTKIMVERVVKTPGLVDTRFTAFTPALLRRDPDERVQIGYRLAHRLKLGSVYGIDEQPEGGEPDYFPFGKVAEFAKVNGMQARIDSLMAKGAEITSATEAKQASASIPELLIDHNDPAGAPSSISVYYELLRIGDAERQPGADLNAMWYLRNAKIFAKLMTVAEPGDRVLVVYGSGHNYWLRHFAANTPGYRSVDPIPYLKQAAP